MGRVSARAPAPAAPARSAPASARGLRFAGAARPRPRAPRPGARPPAPPPPGSRSPAAPRAPSPPRSTLTNVPGYISVSVGLKNQTILNLGEFGEVGYPPLSVAKKLDVFGILPKTAFPNPSLQAFVNAMCVTTDTKNVFAAAAINAYVNATTAGQLPAVQFKLNKGACFPALP